LDKKQTSYYIIIKLKRRLGEGAFAVSSRRPAAEKWKSAPTSFFGSQGTFSVMMPSGKGKSDTVTGGSNNHAANGTPGETKSVKSETSINASVVEGVAANDVARSHKRGSNSDAEQRPSGSQSGNSTSQSAAESEHSSNHATKHKEQADEVEGKGEAREVVVSFMVVQELLRDVVRGAEVLLR